MTSKKWLIGLFSFAFLMIGTIAHAQVDWFETDSGSSYYIFNKPETTVNNNVSRSFNSNFTIATSSLVSYSINASWTLTALLGGSATAFLEYSMNDGASWITVNQVGKSLNLLTFTGSDDMNLMGYIPTQALTRIRTTSSNMTLTYVRGQEVANP